MQSIPCSLVCSGVAARALKPAKNGTKAAGVQAAVAYGWDAKLGDFPYIATL